MRGSVLPSLTERAEAFLNAELSWDAIPQPLLGHQVNAFKALFNRIDALSETLDTLSPEQAERAEAVLGALYDYASEIAPE